MALSKEIVVCGASGGRCGQPAGRPLPTRKQLDHRGPLSIDVSAAWYFITICAEGHKAWKMTNPDGRAGAPRTPSMFGGAGAPRTPNPPTFDSIARVLLQHAREYHQMGKWFIPLFLVMPDHLHFIVKAANWRGGDGVRGGGGVRGAPALPRLIANWKHWLTANYGIRFQANFWDTRLRNEEHYAEKFRYICNNPVRKGLCGTARDWAHVIAFNRETGEKLAHKGRTGKGSNHVIDEI